VWKNAGNTYHYFLLFLGSSAFLASMLVVYAFMCRPMLLAAARNPFENMGSIIRGLELHGVAMYLLLVSFPLLLVPFRAVSFDASLRRMFAGDFLYIYLPMLIPILGVEAYYGFVAAGMPPGVFAERFLDMVRLAEIMYLVLTVYVTVLGVPLSIVRAAGLDMGVGRLVLYGLAAAVLAKLIASPITLLVGAATHRALVTCSAARLGIHSLNPNLSKLEDLFTVTPEEAAGLFLMPLLYYYLLVRFLRKSLE